MTGSATVITARQFVRARLERLGIKPLGLTVGRLAKLTPEKQASLFDHLGKIRSMEGFTTLRTPKLKVLAGYEYPKGEEFRRWMREHCMVGNTLDLRFMKVYTLTSEEEKKIQVMKAEEEHLEEIRKKTGEAAPTVSPFRFLDDSKVINIGGFTDEVINKPFKNLVHIKGTVIALIREFQLGIYRKIYPDKSDEELILQLSLQDEAMEKKLILVDQIQIIREGAKIVGVTSSELIQVFNENALYIPYTMISAENWGKKLHVRMVYETAKHAVQEIIGERGLFGLWDILVGGLPIIARTQSKKVIVDLTKRGSKYFVPVKGAKPDPRTERIIRRVAFKLNSSLDEGLIFRNVYNGKISTERPVDPEKHNDPVSVLVSSLGDRDAVPVLVYAKLLAFLRTGSEMRRLRERRKSRGVDLIR